MTSNDQIIVSVIEQTCDEKESLIHKDDVIAKSNACQTQIEQPNLIIVLLKLILKSICIWLAIFFVGLAIHFIIDFDFQRNAVQRTNEVGGATSGKEVFFYRQHDLSDVWTFPSENTILDPFLSINELISSKTIQYPGLEILSKCMKHSTKMAVMTSISKIPTIAEIGITLLSDPWCLLVIGDKKGPTYKEFMDSNNLEQGIASYIEKMSQMGDSIISDISTDVIQSRLAYIDVNEQQILPYSLKKLTPYGSFSRKNLGFLLAIHSGASIIFDVDDDNIYVPNTSVTGNNDLPIDYTFRDYLSSEQIQHKLKTKDQYQNIQVKYVNPYPTFGLHDSWPRGFPLRSIKSTLAPPNNRTMFHEQCFSKRIRCNAVVQQYLASHDPDVDAIYRLTNPRILPFDFMSTEGETTLPNIARETPSIALEPNSFSPFNAQATIITPGAFILMLLPSTVHGRVADIWRSYFMETLFTYFHVNNQNHIIIKDQSYNESYVPACMIFTAPHIYHDRNSHNYQLDLNSEIPLYTSAEALTAWLSQRMFGRVDDLMNRTDSKATSLDGSSVLADLMIQLYVDLTESGILETDDLYYVQAWISDLQRMPSKNYDTDLNSKTVSSTNKNCFPKYQSS